MPRRRVKENVGQELRDIAKMMINKANELVAMVDTTIPEAFPIIRVNGGPEGEWQRYYSQDEFFGAQRKTELEDAHRTYDVLTKLQTVVISLQLVVSSLYPTEFKGATHEIKIRDAFDKTKEWLDDVKAVLDQCQRTILTGIDSGVKMVIERGNLRKLRNHIVRIGYEYVNEGKVPAHLTVDRVTQSLTENMEDRVNRKIQEEAELGG